METLNYKITLKRGQCLWTMYWQMLYNTSMKINSCFYSLVQTHSRHHPLPLLLSTHSHRLIRAQQYKHEVKKDPGSNHLTTCVLSLLVTNIICQILAVIFILLGSFLPIFVVIYTIFHWFKICKRTNSFVCPLTSWGILF